MEKVTKWNDGDRYKVAQKLRELSKQLTYTDGVYLLQVAQAVEPALTREDINQALEDGECIYCGGELGNRLVGDESYNWCSDCNRATN